MSRNRNYALFLFQRIMMVVVFFAACLTVTFAHAKDKVATLKGIKGVVEVKSADGGGWKAVSDGTALYAQDSVRTKLGAEAQIVFSAGHNVKISSLSTIVVAAPRKANPKDKDKNPVSDVKVNFGKVFAKVKKSTTGTPTKFEIATPTAVAGIRGTMLSEDVESPSGNEGGATPPGETPSAETPVNDTPPENPPADAVCTTTVAEGEVVVSNDAGEEVDVKEGQEVSADATGDLPEEASPMSEENKGEWESNKEWVEQVETEVEGAVPAETTTPATETATTPTTETPATTEATTETPATTEATTETPATTEATTETTTEAGAETTAEATAAEEDAAAADAGVNIFQDNTDLQDDLAEFNEFGMTFTPEQDDIAQALEEAASSGTLDELLESGIDFTNIDDAALVDTLSDLAESGSLDDLVNSGVDLSQIDNLDELVNAVGDAGITGDILDTIESGAAAGTDDAVNADTTIDDIGTEQDTFDVPETPEDALEGTDITVDEETFTQ